MSAPIVATSIWLRSHRLRQASVVRSMHTRERPSVRTFPPFCYDLVNSQPVPWAPPGLVHMMPFCSLHITVYQMLDKEYNRMPKTGTPRLMYHLLRCWIRGLMSIDQRSSR